ncbi:hypothetical protein BDN70DRAFT_458961 [Pholiota conissans]|uniref:Uncharacterized protein n=1 Tax=Pholiota conissans TaxID=109636 RepID=A0A9P6CYY7_9AGAR|nr:hypothetical protein BDN70DRAFT_458961 [Pholiota conissans]
MTDRLIRSNPSNSIPQHFISNTMRRQAGKQYRVRPGRPVSPASPCPYAYVRRLTKFQPLVGIARRSTGIHYTDPQSQFPAPPGGLMLPFLSFPNATNVNSHQLQRFSSWETTGTVRRASVHGAREATPYPSSRAPGSIHDQRTQKSVCYGNSRVVADKKEEDMSSPVIIR